MATDQAGDSATTTEPAGEVVERHNRRTRWFHAGVYGCVLVLLATGWWLLTGQEGQPSPLARVTGIADARLHTVVGWVLGGLAAAGVVFGWRAARTLLRDSVRFRHGDLRWFRRWPAAVFTGRFPRHDGHFDPGQRVANLVLVVLLAALVGSGVGLALIPGGPAFRWLHLVHRWSTYLITPVLLGHILIAAGILPGYRGAWRAMHLGGRLPVQVARRLWPGWLDRHRASRHGGEDGRDRR